MTTIHFTLSVKGLDDGLLVVRGFEGQESLSDSHFQNNACFGFRYHIDLASRNPSIKPEEVVDLNAELRIYYNGECVQRVHGIVRQFTQGEIGHHYSYYSLTLVPALERLSLRQNSRIFQQQTTVNIVSTLLEEMGIEAFAFALREKCQPREFCVQYRETDLEFLHRLAAEEGWVYSFEHLQGKHTLLFTDHATVIPTLDEPVIYNNLSGGRAEVPYISIFSKQTQAEVAKTELKDYSFKAPAYHFSHNQYGSDIGYQRDSYEHYDYPGRYKDEVSGKKFSQIRLEYLRRAAQLAKGQSNQPLIRPGTRFEMIGHANPEMNGKWVVVSTVHKGTQPQALEEEGGQGATTYSNHFHVIPSPQTWRATPQPKPQVDGSMIAIVAGPPGEEIFCDKHGRVKVHFPWDRYSKQDEKSSCWVRVSQGWAGSQYGMMAIPRIGHEVIVSFLNGDPDQPIITGRAYHAKNPPPYPLPDNKTKTVWRSDTHQGQGFNEITFEDQQGSEQVFIHAQKDQKIEVLNDKNQTVGHDETHEIGNDHTLTIKHDRTKHVLNNETATIDMNETHKVGQNRDITVGHDETHTVEKNQTVKVDGIQNITVQQAQTETYQSGQTTNITKDRNQTVTGTLAHNVTKQAKYSSSEEVLLQCGGSSVSLKPDGISLIFGSSTIELKAEGVFVNGEKIKLN